jgi:two-component system cell cycle response regulator DivK
MPSASAESSGMMRSRKYIGNWPLFFASEDGAQGVAAAEAHRPDLILMDIQMPVLDGYEATRRIKANPALRAIPIIVVTSYALSGDEDKARAAGCDDYITKPYSPRQLLAKIKEHLH